MNIILLDKDSRRFKASISQFESFIWTERYWEYGDFELVVPLNVRNVSLIGLDDYLKIPTSDTLMIVENIEYVSPVKDEGGKFNITGRSLDSILDRRILFQDYKKSIKAEAFITQMVKACFKDSNNSDRSIDYLYIEENNDPDVETDPVNVDESKGTNLGDIVLKNAKDNELGFRINFKNDGSFHFEVFAGKDKKYIVFSENNLLLEEAKVYQSNADLKTFSLVSGVDSDITVNVEGSPTGINRRETYSGSYSINKTDPGYRNELELKGKNDLEDHVIIKTIEGQLLNIGKYRLRRDFDLGDLITIQNPYYKAEARITEVIQSWNQEGYLIYPGFIAKDIYSSTISPNPTPEPEPDPKPETPEIPDDQTPTKLINVEIISAIKMYTNFIIGGTSRTYHQIYIPNYDPSDPENRPIKRFGIRLRGLLPEGWAAGFYSIYCDIFLGSEQKLGTIKIKFSQDDRSFIGDWYSYLAYDSPYIRLYLYVIANEIAVINISDDQEPFINGLVDIRLNNIEGQIYTPSKNGDQLTCQTTYIWENNGNFHRYASANSTNVTGVENVDITVLKQICFNNESMLNVLDKIIDNGMRSYEYDHVSLDNLELVPIETGIIEVPPSDGNYNIPSLTNHFEEQTIGNFGWRQTIAEVIKSQLANPRSVSGSNNQEFSLLFTSKSVLPSVYTNLVYPLQFIAIAGRARVIFDNSNGMLRSISVYGIYNNSQKTSFKIVSLNKPIYETDLGPDKKDMFILSDLAIDHLKKIELSLEYPDNSNNGSGPHIICAIFNKNDTFDISDLYRGSIGYPYNMYNITYGGINPYDTKTPIEIDIEVETFAEKGYYVRSEIQIVNFMQKYLLYSDRTIYDFIINYVNQSPNNQITIKVYDTQGSSSGRSYYSSSITNYPEGSNYILSKVSEESFPCLANYSLSSYNVGGIIKAKITNKKEV